MSGRFRSHPVTRHSLFRVGVTRDFLDNSGSLAYGDIGIDLLKAHPQVHADFLPDHHDSLPDSVGRDFDALLVLAPRVTAETLSRSDRLTVIARFGVGYDSVDVGACTNADVMLTIAPDGVRRPVATSALALLFALSHRLLQKDRLTREGRWNEKLHYMGIGLSGRTFGLIGFGNIGQEIARLSSPFEMQLVAHDPFADPDTAARLGVRLVSLEQLLAESDFVCVCCSLTPTTRYLLKASQLELMKPSAFLINVARGPVIEQKSLTEALQRGRLAGAGLDVFETEPIASDDPLLKLDNVIVAPHAICWTDEMFRGIGRSACQSILDVAEGRVPKDIVNRNVLERASLQSKLARYRA